MFVGLENGLEGLLHISELADHKVENPEEVVKVGDEIEVKILRVDADERKIGLSRKRVEWAEEDEARPKRPSAPADDGARAAARAQGRRRLGIGPAVQVGRRRKSTDDPAKIRQRPTSSRHVEPDADDRHARFRLQSLHRGATGQLRPVAPFFLVRSESRRTFRCTASISCRRAVRASAASIVFAGEQVDPPSRSRTAASQLTARRLAACRSRS